MNEQQMTHAVELLQGAPWHWTVTYEYPGFGLIVFKGDQDTPDRGYAFGLANPTITVDQVSGDLMNSTGRGVDTKLPTVEADGYRIAIHVAVAVDVMEQEG